MFLKWEHKLAPLGVMMQDEEERTRTKQQEVFAHYLIIRVTM